MKFFHSTMMSTKPNLEPNLEQLHNDDNGVEQMQTHDNHFLINDILPMIYGK
jgi:hypothetical protein